MNRKAVGEGGLSDKQKERRKVLSNTKSETGTAANAMASVDPQLCNDGLMRGDGGRLQV